jgi:hypothetical protein
VFNPVWTGFEALTRGLAEADGQSELDPRAIWVAMTPVPIPPVPAGGPADHLEHFLRYCPDFEVLDVIDGVIQEVRALFYDDFLTDEDREVIKGEHCFGMNTIFEEEGIGYRWAGLELVRFDDPVSHSEAI